MTDLRFPQLLDTIRATRGAYYKLTILAGDARAGKTQLLRQIAAQLDLPLINLSLILSQRLLNQSIRQRSLHWTKYSTRPFGPARWIRASPASELRMGRSVRDRARLKTWHDLQNCRDGRGVRRERRQLTRLHPHRRVPR